MRQLLLFIILSYGFTTQAQDYSVIHVIGKIYDTQKKVYLAAGTRLDKSSKLRFDDVDARAAVLSNEKGRYIIQKTKEGGSQSDLVYSLASVISPARGKLSTRAGGINNQLDFEKRFGEGPVVWIGDTYKLEISKVAYPTNEHQFFYASYKYNNETINKKLDCKEGVLIFERNTFFSVDEKAISPEHVSDVMLYYYNANTQESTKLTSIQFALVSKSEFCGIQENIGEKDVAQEVDALFDILNSLYGQCSKDEIKATIEEM